MKKSKIHYDEKSDAVYIVLKKDKEHSFEEVDTNIIIEYNKKNQPIGIEILKASSFLFAKN